MRDQLGFETTRPWMLGSAWIPLERGGIIHAYPRARFIAASEVDPEDGVLVTFLHREPQTNVEEVRINSKLELPNHYEVEYDVRVVSGDAMICDLDPEIVDTFYLEGRPHIVIVKRAE